MAGEIKLAKSTAPSPRAGHCQSIRHRGFLGLVLSQIRLPATISVWVKTGFVILLYRGLFGGVSKRGINPAIHNRSYRMIYRVKSAGCRASSVLAWVRFSPLAGRGLRVSALSILPRGRYPLATVAPRHSDKAKPRQRVFSSPSWDAGSLRFYEGRSNTPIPPQGHSG